MTALVFVICLISGAVHFYSIGPFLYDGITIYTATYFSTTGTAALYCALTKKRSNIAAGCCIIAYSICAPQVYMLEYAIIWSALLDIFMAAYFILLGQRRWEIYAGLCFLFAVAISVLTAAGLVPSHLDRPYEFIAFSQPDITALAGHAANIIIGLGAADGGRKVRDYLATRRVVGDFGYGFRFMFVSQGEAPQEG